MAPTRLVSAATLVVLLGSAAAAYVDLRTPPPKPVVTTRPIDRGDIVETVIATGALQPVRSVTIGAQVSGEIRRVFVDFNSLVHTGEVLAEIDPSIVQADLESARARLGEAQIALESDTATRDTDEREANRMEELFSRGLSTEQERDAARLQLDEDVVQAKQDTESARVAQANVDSAALDLAHCRITSPIDGVVIARNVDAGQTVQSRVTAPSLFLLGTDLTSLTLIGDVDESDIARVRQGQPVSFTVEAYPAPFRGVVTEARLNATTVSNVVTYQVMISVDNPERRLLPGMTASFKVETGRATDVPRVLNTALRFRPTPDILSFYGRPPLARATADVMKPIPVTPTASGPVAADQFGARIDRQFKAFPRSETSAQVWLTENGSLRPTPVTIGMTDGVWSEVRDSSLAPGQLVVTNAVMPVQRHR